MTADDPRLRFRLWIAGGLVSDEWVDTSEPGAQARVDQIQAAHLEVTKLAEQRGQRWLIEVHDPARPPDSSVLRFGTDRDGMWLPVPVTDVVPAPGRNHPDQGAGTAPSVAAEPPL